MSQLKKIFSRKKLQPASAHQQNFGELGLEYFVCGRFSFFCGFPVTGNLLHHAVEMFLKMAMTKYYSDEQFKKVFRHRLRRLWKEFKKKNKRVPLNSYDQVIKDLDKWENIRYPTPEYKLLSLGLNRSPTPAKRRGPTPNPYALWLSEVDELVRVIFQTSEISPKRFRRVFIGTEIGPEAKRFYDFENKFPLSFG